MTRAALRNPSAMKFDTFFSCSFISFPPLFMPLQRFEWVGRRFGHDFIWGHFELWSLRKENCPLSITFFLSFNFLFHHKKPEKIEEGRETEDEEDDEEEEDEQEKETETVVEKRELDKFSVETREELAYFR